MTHWMVKLVEVLQEQNKTNNPPQNPPPKPQPTRYPLLEWEGGASHGKVLSLRMPCRAKGESYPKGCAEMVVCSAQLLSGVPRKLLLEKCSLLLASRCLAACWCRSWVPLKSSVVQEQGREDHQRLIRGHR